MATWPTITDRNVEKPNQVVLTATSGQDIYNLLSTGLTVDVVENPGSVVSAGTPVNTSLFNQIKAYLDDQFGETFKYQNAVVTDMAWSTISTLARGTYKVSNAATNSPDAGQWGNLLVGSSYGTDRFIGIVAFDDGRVFQLSGFGTSSVWSEMARESDIVKPVVSGNWTYWKYPDGTLVCSIKSASISFSSLAAVGALWYQSYAAYFTYPVPFVGVPSPQTSFDNQGNNIVWAIPWTQNSSTTCGVILLGASNVTTSGYVNLYVVGKWK